MQTSSESMRILSIFENKPISKEDLAKETNGRPFFPNRDVDFNISHSCDFIAVSYTDCKNTRTGCDIEKIRTRQNAIAIAKEYFSESENIYLFNDGNFNLKRFYEIWTLKECFIKLRGLSVFDIGTSPSFIQENNFSFNLSSSLPVTFRLYDITNEQNENYVLAAAIEGENQSQPEIRLLSSVSLDCKITAEIKAAVNPAQTVSPNR